MGTSTAGWLLTASVMMPSPPDGVGASVASISCCPECTVSPAFGDASFVFVPAAFSGAGRAFATGLPLTVEPAAASSASSSSIRSSDFSRPPPGAAAAAYVRTQ
uniref:Putative secreted protein n=1 Tax=Ixodes ricinus TaxID=34613 RepID=A0A6B0UAG2_IXORI